MGRITDAASEPFTLDTRSNFPNARPVRIDPDRIRTLPRAEYSPAGWWAGLAGPFPTRAEADDFSRSAHMSGSVYLCDGDGEVIPCHLHTPTGRTYCGAPAPADRVNGWTAYRSEATCEACLTTLSPAPRHRADAPVDTVTGWDHPLPRHRAYVRR